MGRIYTLGASRDLASRDRLKACIALGVRYAETKSLRLDFKIMAWTLPALITQVKETRAKRRAQALLPRAVAAAAHPPLVQAVPSARPEPVHRVRSAANLVEHK